MNDWMADLVQEFRVRKEDDAAELLEAMAASTECLKVWQAIGKRLGVATKLHRDRLLKFYPSMERNSIPSKDMVSEVEHLTYSVQGALQKPKFCDSATGTQRNRLNAKFSKAAASMIEVLDELAGDDDIFTGTDGALTQFAVAIAHEALQRMREDQCIFGVNADERADAEFVARYCLFSPVELIGPIREDVLRWANTRPLIPKPDAENARRLLLIRRLSSLFKDRYGTPLRACTLAITGVFFDIDGLDEATIAKLAP
ncbi:MAG: hypothetical protein ABI247_12400 [Rhodanobacter sp.]